MANTKTLTLYGLDSYIVGGIIRKRGQPFVIGNAAYDELSATQQLLFTSLGTFPVARSVDRKVYDALATQTSTNAPVDTVLENSLGEIKWTYSEAGVYIGTLKGAFPAAKTRLWTPNVPLAYGSTVVSLRRLTDDTIELSSAPFGLAATNGLITAQPILILVG